MSDRKILLVEDDNYKKEAILAVLGGRYSVQVDQSVATAVRSVIAGDFNLVILDMALPTYERTAGTAGGSSQPQGGVEVLRAMKHSCRHSVVIIVSQYAGVEIDGDFASLEESRVALCLKYGLNVVAAIEYDFEDNSWRNEFEEAMRKI